MFFSREHYEVIFPFINCFHFLETQNIMNRRFNIEEAVQFVLTPGSDSELSDIDEDEEDKTFTLEKFNKYIMFIIDISSDFDYIFLLQCHIEVTTLSWILVFPFSTDLNLDSGRDGNAQQNKEAISEDNEKE